MEEGKIRKNGMEEAKSSIRLRGKRGQKNLNLVV